jgi:regulator of RNase E activity RraA
MCKRDIAKEHHMDIDKLFSGMFSDVMDSLGYKHQIITGFQRNQSLLKFIGRARTLKIESLDTDDENIKTGLGFLAEIERGEVLIVQGSKEFAYFGELMTRLSLRQGIEGIVIDGLTRDTNFTHDNCKLPILAKGYSPVDIKGRGRVSFVDVPVVIEGVMVNKGDLIFADNEAVCVIPEKIEKTIIALIEEKKREEKQVIQLIESGISIPDLLKQVKEF